MSMTKPTSEQVTFLAAGAGASQRTALDKLRDTVSVKDFGAVGDGVTNDALAIQSALNSGASRITFPAGSYLINTRILCPQSNIEVDFGTAILLNTVALPIVQVYGYDTNAMFDFTGTAVRVSGGMFKNGLSECIRITGVFASGDTFTGAGYTADHQVSDVIFDNCNGNSCNIRFAYNVAISGLVVRNKGSGYAGHQQELGFSYCTGVTVSSCQVRDAKNGGAVYFLYVDGFTCTGCTLQNISNSNSSNAQSTVAIYASRCSNGTSSANTISVAGGSGIKYSYDCQNMGVFSSLITVNPTANEDQFAAVFLQGVDGFVIDGNRMSNVGNHVIRLTNHTTPTNLNTKNGIVSNNWLTTTYGTGIEERTYDGDAIYVASLTTVARGPIDIVGNRLVTGNMYVLQSEDSRISGNMLMNSDNSNPYLVGSAALFVDRVRRTLIESNVIVDNTGSGTRYGIRMNAGSFNFIYDNVVQYQGGSGVAATAFLQEGVPTSNRWVENLPLNAATAYSGIGGSNAVQTQILRVVQTFNIDNVPANSTITFERTVTGANIGDMVLINAYGVTSTLPQDSLTFNAYVTETDTITVIASNNTSSAIDLGNRDYNILLFKQAIY